MVISIPDDRAELYSLIMKQDIEFFDKCLDLYYCGSEFLPFGIIAYGIIDRIKAVNKTEVKDGKTLIIIDVERDFKIVLE